MNRTRLLMIGFVALALAAFVSFSVYRRLNNPGGANVAPGDNIVIAATDISLGAKIEDMNVRVVQLPAADLPPRHFRQKSQVLGRGVIVPIAKGEYVLPEKLAGENAGSGLPALIPTGMRAVSVRVNEVIGVAGFVVPGTRVDVLLTGSPSGSGGERTTTVLENVAVIASGQRLERSVTGEAQTAPVITLLVSPDDAQRLALAQSQGKIQLSLRNPLDTKQQELPSVQENVLYRGVSAPAKPMQHSKAPKQIVLTAPAPASGYQVEIYRGEKKDVTKFDSQ
jgi:pilus assembly protein CpaB